MDTYEFKLLPSVIIHVYANHKQLIQHVSKTTCTFTCLSVWYSMIGRTVCFSKR